MVVSLVVSFLKFLMNKWKSKYILFKPIGKDHIVKWIGCTMDTWSVHIQRVLSCLYLKNHSLTFRCAYAVDVQCICSDTAQFYWNILIFYAYFSLSPGIRMKWKENRKVYTLHDGRRNNINDDFDLGLHFIECFSFFFITGLRVFVRAQAWMR